MQSVVRIAGVEGGTGKDPRERTCCERINSQAQALGIERPKVRNSDSLRNLNTLIYIIINVRALQRAQSINRGLLQMN